MAKSQKKHKSYKKPPIVEAVIEVRFEDMLASTQLDKLISKQKTKFNVQKIEEVELKISGGQPEAGAQAETKTRLVGYKLTSNLNASDIIQVKANALSISRLPPYEGWENLLKDLKHYYNWYTNKKFKSLSRIGVRYINRIDIPSDGKIKVEDYFKIFPHVPQTKFPDMNHFLVQTAAAIDNEKLLTINMHRVPSPLLKHASIIFDLDVAQQANLPKNDAQLYQLLDEIREKKDFFFETLLTPKCKKLFNS